MNLCFHTHKIEKKFGNHCILAAQWPAWDFSNKCFIRRKQVYFLISCSTTILFSRKKKYIMPENQSLPLV